MPPKMRPPNIASLTGDRSAKELRMTTVLRRVKRRCQVAEQAISSTDQPEVSGGHRTRSKGAKGLYKLLVNDCMECNLRNIEAFREELQQLGPNVHCSHGKMIQQVDPADPNESPRYPAIEIPALTGGGLRGAAGGAVGSVSIVSGGSSITVEKLEAIKVELDQVFEELSVANEELMKAVEEAEEGQLIGYEDVYSRDALTEFIARYSDQYEDVGERLEETTRQLKDKVRLDEVGGVDSVFEDNASSDTR